MSKKWGLEKEFPIRNCSLWFRDVYQFQVQLLSFVVGSHGKLYMQTPASGRNNQSYPMQTSQVTWILGPISSIFILFPVVIGDPIPSPPQDEEMQSESTLNWCVPGAATGAVAAVQSQQLVVAPQMELFHRENDKHHPWIWGIPWYTAGIPNF